MRLALVARTRFVAPATLTLRNSTSTVRASGRLTE